MSTEAPAAAETPSGSAAPAAPGSDPSPAEAPVAVPDGTTPAPEGEAPETPGTEAPPEPSGPSEAQLAKWSQKLNRREEKLKAQRIEFEAKQKSLDSELQLAKAFESKKVKPLIEAYAKRQGLTFEQAYNALTHEAVNPDVPTVDEVVDARIAAKEAERQQQFQQQQETAKRSQAEAFVKAAEPYVRSSDGIGKHEYLAALDPDVVVRVALETVVGTWWKTGKEIPLDQVLSDMNAYEKQRVDKHLSRLRPGDPQIQANSERENGAGQSAKLETRKRGSPQTLNNSHAAQQATAPSDDDDLSDKALTAKAVKALRAIPGWH